MVSCCIILASGYELLGGKKIVACAYREWSILSEQLVECKIRSTAESDQKFAKKFLFRLSSII